MTPLHCQAVVSEEPEAASGLFKKEHKSTLKALPLVA